MFFNTFGGRRGGDAHLLVLPGDKSGHLKVQRRAEGRRRQEAAADAHRVEVVPSPVADAAQPPRVAAV